MIRLGNGSWRSSGGPQTVEGHDRQSTSRFPCRCPLNTTSKRRDIPRTLVTRWARGRRSSRRRCSPFILVRPNRIVVRWSLCNCGSWLSPIAISNRDRGGARRRAGAHGLNVALAYQPMVSAISAPPDRINDGHEQRRHCACGWRLLSSPTGYGSLADRPGCLNGDHALRSRLLRNSLVASARE
jgi:hypothetical protein